MLSSLILSVALMAAMPPPSSSSLSNSDIYRHNTLQLQEEAPQPKLQEEDISVIDYYYIIVFDKNMEKIDGYSATNIPDEPFKELPEKISSSDLINSEKGLFCYYVQCARIFNVNGSNVMLKTDPYYVIKNQ